MYLKHPRQTNSLLVVMCSAEGGGGANLSLSSLACLSFSLCCRTVIGRGAPGFALSSSSWAAFAARRRALTDSPSGLERNRPPLPRARSSAAEREVDGVGSPSRGAGALGRVGGRGGGAAMEGAVAGAEVGAEADGRGAGSERTVEGGGRVFEGRTGISTNGMALRPDARDPGELMLGERDARRGAGGGGNLTDVEVEGSLGRVGGGGRVGAGEGREDPEASGDGAGGSQLELVAMADPPSSSGRTSSGD